MSISDENIEQAVIVEVQKTCSPFQKRNCRLDQSRLIGDVGEYSVSLILEEHAVVVGKIRNVEIDFPVAVVVADADAHRRHRPAIFCERKTREVSVLFEGSIVTIVVKKVRSGIIRDQRV